MSSLKPNHSLLQSILKDAFESEIQGVDHPCDDEDLLLRWSGRQLSEKENDDLLKHLADCSSCRKNVSEMIQNGILELQESEANSHQLHRADSKPKSYHSTLIFGGVMTSSLCLLACCFFFFLHGGTPDSTDIAQNPEPQGSVKFRGAADDAPQTDQFALLIGINKYGKLKEKEHLDGCRNDIEEVKRVITNRFGFKDNNVTVLLDEQATASNIREQLRALTKKVQARPQEAPPAQVLFYFSGHGSQVPDQPEGDPDRDADDGLDSTLVVYDSERQGSDTDIRDDELNHFAHDICQGGRAELLIALDSCHSGGGARGGITKFRGIDRDLDRTIEAGKDRNVAGMTQKTLPDGTVFLSACQTNQKEPEYRKDGKTYGLFTYHFVKLLESEQIVSALSYETLVDAIHRSYQRNKISQSPTPTVEGDREKIVFGAGRFANRKPYWETTRNASNKDVVRMEAGTTSGITKYSLFELYDTVKDTLDPTAKSIGWFEIEKVSGVYSLGKLFEWSDKEPTQRKGIPLPKGFRTGFAVERYHDHGDNILAVKLLDVTTDKIIEPNDPIVPAPISSALIDFDQHEESKWINWIGEEGDCDVVLKFDSKAKMAALFPATGWNSDDQVESKTRGISDVPEALRGGWGPIEWGPEEGKETLREKYLRKIIVGVSLKRLLAEKPMSTKTRGDHQNPLIESKVFRPNDEGEFEEVKVDTRKGIVLECGNGERYQLRIKNNDETPFYVTVLAIDPDMEISQLSHGPMSNPRRFNARNGTSNDVNANKLDGDGEIVANFMFAEPYGLQTLIVLATREPSNFSSFVQGGLGRIRGNTKGAVRSNTSRVFRFINEQCSVGTRAVVEHNPRNDDWVVGTVDVIAEPTNE